MVKYLAVSAALLVSTSAALATGKGTMQRPPLRHVGSSKDLTGPKYTLRRVLVLRDAKDKSIKKYTVQEAIKPQDAEEKNFYAVHPVKIRPSQEGLGKANVDELMEVNFYAAARQVMAQKMGKKNWVDHGHEFLRRYVAGFETKNTEADALLLEEAELKARGASEDEKRFNLEKMYAFFAAQMIEVRRRTGGSWEASIDPGLKGYYRAAVEAHSTSKNIKPVFAEVLYDLYDRTYHNPMKDPSPGVIDPNGMPSLSDGHHGLSQAYTLMERIKSLDPAKRDADFNVILNITENFSKPGKQLKFSHYLMDLCEKRKLYFSPQTRADIIAAMQLENKRQAKARKGLTRSTSEHADDLAQAFERAVNTVFAKDIKGMAHDPMRSFVGALLPNLPDKFDPGRNHRARLTNKVMVDFAEFYVAEWLLAQGFVAGFNEKTIQLSRPDRLDPNYNAKMADYVLTLKGMQDARELIYGKKPEEFRRDVLLPLWDQAKFDACEKDAKAKSRKVSEDCPNFLEEFDTQLARYKKDYSQTWPELANVSPEAKDLLAKLTPDNVGVKASALVPAAGQNPHCTPKASQSLANLTKDLLALTAGGTCLNPLKRNPDDLLMELEQGAAAAAAAGPKRLAKVAVAVKKAPPQVLEEVAKAGERGWINFR